MLIKLLPWIIVLSFSLINTILDLFSFKIETQGYFSSAGFFASIIASIYLLLAGESLSKYMLMVNDFSLFFAILFTIGGFFVSIGGIDYFEDNQSEFYPLLGFSVLGMMVVASSTDLIMIYIGMELATLSLIPMIALSKTKKISIEASVKYLIINGIASAIFLYGISLIFADVGSTSMNQITSSELQFFNPLAIAFVLVGAGFKVSSVPFQFWAPDVYEGAPTPVTSFLNSSSKKMGLSAAFIIFPIALASFEKEWSMVFAILATITMTVGNVGAILQENIKRLFAYSSISQSGYMLMALAIATKMGYAGGLLQALTHTIAGGVALIIISGIGISINSNLIKDYSGIGKSLPILSTSITICLLSLAGVPPLGGFMSKLTLFLAAIQGELTWLAVIAIINSTISIYYYSRIIKQIFFVEDKETKIEISRKLKFVAASASIILFLIGIYFQPFLEAAINAASFLI